MEKLLGKGSAIGKILQRQEQQWNFSHAVIGVVKDYVYGDMYGQSAPVIFYYIPQAARLYVCKIKLHIAILKRLWQRSEQ